MSKAFDGGGFFKNLKYKITLEISTLRKTNVSYVFSRHILFTSSERINTHIFFFSTDIDGYCGKIDMKFENLRPRS